MKDGKSSVIERPHDFPPSHLVAQYYERMVAAAVITPQVLHVLQPSSSSPCFATLFALALVWPVLPVCLCYCTRISCVACLVNMSLPLLSRSWSFCSRGAGHAACNPCWVQAEHCSTLSECSVSCCVQSTLGVVLRLLQDRRGEQVELAYLDKERVMLRYLLPWQEVGLQDMCAVPPCH
jgi:hypothetical protein